MLNDGGTLFHQYFDIVDPQKQFETFNTTLYWHLMFSMYTKSLLQIQFELKNVLETAMKKSFREKKIHTAGWLCKWKLKKQHKSLAWSA